MTRILQHSSSIKYLKFVKNFDKNWYEYLTSNCHVLFNFTIGVTLESNKEYKRALDLLEYVENFDKNYNQIPKEEPWDPLHVKFNYLNLVINMQNLEIYNKFVNALAEKKYGTKIVSNTPIEIRKSATNMLSSLFKLNELNFVHTLKTFSGISNLKAVRKIDVKDGSFKAYLKKYGGFPFGFETLSTTVDNILLLQNLKAE